MNMNAIRYFLAVCEEGSFTRAARRTGVSQPSLSVAIMRLEQRLGAPLFVRKRNEVCLSALGRALQPHFRKIDQCAGEIERKAAAFGHSRRGELDGLNGGHDLRPIVMPRSARDRRPGNDLHHSVLAIPAMRKAST